MNDSSAIGGEGHALGQQERHPAKGVLNFFRHHGVWAPGVRLFRSVDFKLKASFISAVFAVPIGLCKMAPRSSASHRLDAA